MTRALDLTKDSNIQLGNEMRVKILRTDKRLGVKAGEVYEARRYSLDPNKMSIGPRVPDGYDPCCNQYVHEVLHLLDGKWHKVQGSKFVSVDD